VDEASRFDPAATSVGTATTDAEYQLALAALADAVESGIDAFVSAHRWRFTWGVPEEPQQRRLRFHAMRLALITRPREEM